MQLPPGRQSSDPFVRSGQAKPTQENLWLSLAAPPTWESVLQQTQKHPDILKILQIKPENKSIWTCILQYGHQSSRKKDCIHATRELLVIFSMFLLHPSSFSQVRVVKARSAGHADPGDFLHGTRGDGAVYFHVAYEDCIPLKSFWNNLNEFYVQCHPFCFLPLRGWFCPKESGKLLASVGHRRCFYAIYPWTSGRRQAQINLNCGDIPFSLDMFSAEAVVRSMFFVRNYLFEDVSSFKIVFS